MSFKVGDIVKVVSPVYNTSFTGKYVVQEERNGTIIIDPVDPTDKYDHGYGFVAYDLELVQDEETSTTGTSVSFYTKDVKVGEPVNLEPGETVVGSSAGQNFRGTTITITVQKVEES